MDAPYVPGTLDYQMSQWMMRSDVRAALHVESSPAKEWPGGAVSVRVSHTHSRSTRRLQNRGRVHGEYVSAFDWWLTGSKRLNKKKMSEGRVLVSLNAVVVRIETSLRSGPTGDWSYTSQWSACNADAPPGTPSMVDFYRYLARARLCRFDSPVYSH